MGGLPAERVDILEKMIEWSRLRAQEAKVGDKVEFRVANLLVSPELMRERAHPKADAKTVVTGEPHH